MTTRPNYALQRTRRERRGCNRCVPCAGSLSLGRYPAQAATVMEAFGVQFRINDEQRFRELCALYSEIKHDKDTNAFRDPAGWVALVPDAIMANFEWPTAKEREHWLSVRDSTPVLIPDPYQLIGVRWDFYRVFESFEEGDYVMLGCERVSDSIGELRIDPCFGYPYGGVGPLIAVAEAFGFEVLGVNESGQFEGRDELLRGGAV